MLNKIMPLILLVGFLVILSNTDQTGDDDKSPDIVSTEILAVAHKLDAELRIKLVGDVLEAVAADKTDAEIGNLISEAVVAIPNEVYDEYNSELSRCLAIDSKEERIEALETIKKKLEDE